jgi:CRISPR-associated endoribonuclease Cas6
MQFKITFRAEQPGQLLPLSYQYELSSWIYKLIGDSNSEFADFLHQQGYAEGAKRFKLFTFSNLYVPKFEIQGDRMKVLCPEISFLASFLVPQAAQDMIMGLFNNQRLRLGDKISQVELSVQGAEMLRLPELHGDVFRLRTTSPLLVSRPQLRPGDKLMHDYLHPADAEYADYFFKNLLDKYRSARKHGLVEEIGLDAPMAFRLGSENPKRRGIRIKAFTPGETKLIGYDFDFELQAPSALVRMGLLAGFGGENALGFGAARVL